MAYKKYLYSLDDKFRRTAKKFRKNVAPHNSKRCEWVGEGKTFTQINTPKSIYRQNIKNGKSLEDALYYDIEKMGWLEKY